MVPTLLTGTHGFYAPGGYSTITGATVAIQTTTVWDWWDGVQPYVQVLVAPPKNWRWFHCHRQRSELGLPAGQTPSGRPRRFTKSCRRDRRTNKRKAYLQSL